MYHTMYFKVGGDTSIAENTQQSYGSHTGSPNTGVIRTVEFSFMPVDAYFSAPQHTPPVPAELTTRRSNSSIHQHSTDGVWPSDATSGRGPGWRYKMDC